MRRFLIRSWCYRLRRRARMKCPICKKEVAPGGQFVPFCSDRCRLIDLGNWASEKYKIVAPIKPEEEVEEEEANRGDEEQN